MDFHDFPMVLEKSGKYNGAGPLDMREHSDERPRRDRRYTQCALTCVRGLDGPTPCECVANLCVLQLYDEQMCSACKFASYLSASFKSLVWIRRLAERISAAHSGSSRLPATWRGCAKLDVSTCGDVQDTSGCSGELLRCSQVYLGSSSHLWRHF